MGYTRLNPTPENQYGDNVLLPHYEDGIATAHVRDNNDFLKGRNIANTADLNMWRINTSDQLEAGTTPMMVGAGDNAPYGGSTSVGTRSHIMHGDGGAPATTGPTLKVVRVSDVPANSWDGMRDSFENSAISGVAKGRAASQTQPVGVFGYAENEATSFNPTYTHLTPDAIGLNGIGWIKAGGVGRAIGIFTEALISSAVLSAGGQAAEFSIKNTSGNEHTWETGGGSQSMGIWLHSGGSTNNVGSAISIGRQSTGRFDVGIGFNNNEPVLTASIRDDGDSTYGLLINGAKSTAGIALAAGAGPILVGKTAREYATSSLLEVKATAVSDPLAVFSTTAGGITVKFINASGGGEFCVPGSAGGFFVGSQAGDCGFVQRAVGKAVHVAGATSIIAVGQDNTLGFFNVARVARQTGGAATAAATYGANEQGMVQRMYDALRNYGLLT